MKFTIFASTSLVLTFLSLGPQKIYADCDKNTPAALSWNQLLRADNLIPKQYNFCLSQATQKTDEHFSTVTILKQLKKLLEERTTFVKIYKNFLVQFDKPVTRIGSKNAQTFAQNLLKIAEHNLHYDAKKVSWSKGVNQFTDITEAEFHQNFLGAQSSPYHNPTLTTEQMLNVQAEAPENFDWRWYSPSVVSPVKNQGNCGSCWAHAVIAQLETMAAIRDRKTETLDLSVQELVDCEKVGSNGCNGGYCGTALDYLKLYGVANASEYPYTQKNGECKRKSNRTPAAQIKNWAQIQRNREADFKPVVYQHGPIVVGLLVSYDWLQYKEGVYDGPCGDANGGHALVIIGYGVEKGVDYWTLKNSWGRQWGAFGYMKIRRGIDKCTISSREGGYAMLMK